MQPQGFGSPCPVPGKTLTHWLQDLIMGLLLAALVIASLLINSFSLS